MQIFSTFLVITICQKTVVLTWYTSLNGSRKKSELRLSFDPGKFASIVNADHGLFGLRQNFVERNQSGKWLNKKRAVQFRCKLIVSVRPAFGFVKSEESVAAAIHCTHGLCPYLKMSMRTHCLVGIGWHQCQKHRQY